MRIVHYSDIENAYDDPQRLGRLAGLLRSLDGSDALLAGSGDNTGPGVLSMVTDGRISLPFFRRVSPAVDTFGNHDFDHGDRTLRSIVDESPQTWTCANVSAERFDAVPWTTVDVGGSTVGVTGVTTTTTPSISPAVSDLSVSDPIETVRTVLDDLHGRGVDATVVLAHLREVEALARETDADVVLGGHVHEPLATVIEGTVVTRPGSTGTYVIEIDLGEQHDSDAGQRESSQITRYATAHAKPDHEVVAAVERQIAATGLDEPIAEVDRPIERTTETTLHGESRIGNFVADAYRWCGDADVGLQNGGGIRDGPPLSGAVTVKDLMGVVPFEERIVVAEVTGEELRAVLREGSGAVVDVGDPSWWNAHLSGVTAVWNRPERRFESLRVDGQPLSPTATYEVATPEYLLGTDFEFPTLTDEQLVRSSRRQCDALVEYARVHGVNVDLEGRIERRGVPESVELLET